MMLAEAILTRLSQRWDNRADHRRGTPHRPHWACSQRTCEFDASTGRGVGHVSNTEAHSGFLNAGGRAEVREARSRSGVARSTRPRRPP
jgi:hypothetical protein